jgi:tetratricopeptide (TPR) repeat protein
MAPSVSIPAVKESPELHGPAETPWWQRGWLFGLFLLAITVTAYLPVWHAGFLWDDDILLTDNTLIRQADGWFRFWLAANTPDYFPMTSTSFWLEWRLWGMNATGYHVTNVLLHACNAILLGRVLARLKIPGAKLAAAIFALHPVSVASVAWIAERKNTLAMLFFLLTLLWWLKFEDKNLRRWYWLSVVAFVLALLSKTAAAPLPFVLLGLAWWRRGRVAWPDILRTALFFAAAGVLALVTIRFQYHNAIGHDLVRTDGFWSRLAVAGRAVWFYFYKVVFPVGLMPVYPRWNIGAVSTISFVPLLLLAAGFFVCWRYRTTWGKAPLFGCGYALVMLLPVLGFLNIYFFRFSLVADHWQYFAIIGIIALAAGGITTALNPFPRGKIFFTGALLLLLGTLTWRQASVYHNAETLWRTTLAGNPDCAVAHDGLGYVLLQNGQTDEALGHFQKAVQISPGYALAHYDLGRVLFQKGEVNGAIAQFQDAVQIKPGYAQAQNNLGGVLLQKGDAEDAIAHLQLALQSNPDNAEAHYNLGNARLRLGHVEEAITEFQKTLQLKPDHAEARYSLGTVLLQKGNVDAAIAQLQKARELKPDYADACYNLGVAFVRKNEANEAAAQFQKTLQIDPHNAEAHYNLGVLLQNSHLDEAITQFQMAVQINPGYAQAHNNLGGALLQKDSVREAIAQFQMVLQITPRDLSAQNNLAWVLATTQQASLRDGNKAVELARRANELAGGENPIILHTLAAALAEAGLFTEAASSIQKAMELAQKMGKPALVAQFNEELKSYHAGLPLRQ